LFYQYYPYLFIAEREICEIKYQMNKAIIVNVYIVALKVVTFNECLDLCKMLKKDN